MMITNNAYLYDGSFEGLLSVVFDIYATKKMPDCIQEEHLFQANLDQQIFLITTDVKKAQRVENGIIKKCGKYTWEKITKAFLSNELDKGMIIFRYIFVALKVGRNVHECLAQDDVLNLENLIFRIHREFERWIGFIRFSKMEQNFYYAAYKPKANITPLLMPFFTDRLTDQPFLIHDTTRNIVGVYTLNEWYLIETTDFTLPEYSDDEQEYVQIWKTFYETVAIPERRNKRCQQTFMPLWYRANMTEFKV